MVIKSGNGKIEEIKESVKEGIIERTDEYKYLGWWFSEANNIRRQLHDIKSRSDYMVGEIKIMGDKIRVGIHVVVVCHDQVHLQVSQGFRCRDS